MLRYFRYLKNLTMTKPKRDIIAIVGTTGVGKSQFSIDLAKAVNGEIINADSMQVYKGLENITNKHPQDERGGIAHYVMDHVNWNEEYFIHRFAEEANEAIERIYNKGKVPIIIGGTHYYLQKLLFHNKTIDDSDRKPLTEDQLKVLDGPVENIFAELEKHDPVIAQKFHPQDTRKLRRALEIWYTLNQKASDLYKEQKLLELEDSSLVYNTLLFWVYSDPDILTERLNTRVDNMINNGAIDEMTEMYNFYNAQNPNPDVTNGVWQVIGFKEFIPWFKAKENPDEPEKYVTKMFDEGVERMKIRTRQYAKYQVKWIKKLLSVELQKESRFNFKYGGKLYLLNATDLSTWETNVKDRGVEIATQFLANGPLSVKIDQKPESIQEGIFPDEIELLKFNSNKRLDSTKNWEHFTCSSCKDKNGKDLVCVGKEAWETHQKSKRHRRSLHKRQKLQQASDNAKPQ